VSESKEDPVKSRLTCEHTVLCQTALAKKQIYISGILTSGGNESTPEIKQLLAEITALSKLIAVFFGNDVW
jgi:hypothetical protein